jgi:hypothetical protein
VRLLHLCPAPFGDGGVVGGAERYATELAKATAAFADVRLAVFGPRAERRPLAPNCELRVLRNLPGLRSDNPASCTSSIGPKWSTATSTTRC